MRISSWLAIGIGMFALAVCAPAQNRVLELDGNGSYVELPPNIFNDLTDATVEGWVKWESIRPEWNRVFNYGAALHDISVAVWNRTRQLYFFIGDDQKGLQRLIADDLVHAGEWCHIAAVSGKGGMKLYYNGVLVGTRDYTGSFAAMKNGDRNYLGKTVTPVDNDREFHGQIDEFRVWKVARSEERIRATMFKRLTGKEPNLVGLWNFDDVQNGVVKDVGPGKHHGKLMGNARVVAAQLPAAPAAPQLTRALQLDGN